MTAVGTAILIVSGCGLRTISGTPVERTLGNAKQFSDYDLSQDEDYKHSEAMQLISLSTRVKPSKANDLDAHADGFNNVSLRTAQATAIGATVNATINPFQAVFLLVGFESQLSKMSRRNKENELFKVIPTDNLTEIEITSKLKEAQIELDSIIKKAYLADDNVANVVFLNMMDEGLSTELYDDYIVPLTETDEVAYCYDKSIYNQFLELKDDPEYSPTSTSLPISHRGCFARVRASGRYYYNDVNSSLRSIPDSDFIVATATLPVLFPVQELRGISDDVYLYQPAAGYFRSANLKALLKTDPGMVKAYWDQDNFVDVPKITNITTAEVLSFGGESK